MKPPTREEEERVIEGIAWALNNYTETLAKSFEKEGATKFSGVVIAGTLREVCGSLGADIRRAYKERLAAND